MDTLNYQTLEALVPPVAEYLVPEIEKAVEVCLKSFMEDEFNDNWIFGTHLWKNTWNRFETLASFEDCPFDICGKGNEYKLKIGPFVVRHHRIDSETQIPKGARAVKSAATAIQLELFDGGGNLPIEKDNIVIAIVADIQNGLREIFIGELMPHSLESKQYRWAKRISVYLSEGAEPSTAEIIQIKDVTGYNILVPEEEIPDVHIGLDKSRTKVQIESEGGK